MELEMINKKLNQNNSNEIYSIQSSYLDENFLNNDEDELIEGQTFFDCLTKYFFISIHINSYKNLRILFFVSFKSFYIINCFS